MLVAYKVGLAFLGLCCCFASGARQCFCIANETCIARNGTVNTKSPEVSTHQCRGEEVICCETLTENSPGTASKNLQEPRVAPGGGCGRKRFSSEIETIKGEDPSSKTAFYGEAPWMVAILDKNLKLRCGGTLIAPKVVLTAAHCLSQDNIKEKLFVKAGEYVTSSTNKPIPSQLQSVHELIYHSGFDGKNITNDIAILVLKHPMELNAIVDVICTPEEGQDVIATECIMTGYGFNSKNGSYPVQLKKMKHTYKNHEYCLEVMKNANALKVYHESNLCLVCNEENRARPGDGGGPLFCPLQKDPNRMVQIGIVSWSTDSKGKFPTALTSVKHYLPWLREKLKRLS